MEERIGFERTKGVGSIQVGKLADLAVLSKELLKVAPKEFLTTEVLYTIVGGKIVYSKSL
jgi:predicted amidohydrolase YtcJ